ncbi:MAG: hypothetical protein MZU97_18995 [Bacillus subtilis]|nr:hypothetical protein [Bacillus subtilis]
MDQLQQPDLPDLPERPGSLVRSLKGYFASQKFTWAGLFRFEKDQFLRTDTKLGGLRDPLRHSGQGGLVAQVGPGRPYGPFRPDSQAGPGPGGHGQLQKLYIDGFFVGRGWRGLDR